jgi:hypothetical protein
VTQSRKLGGRITEPILPDKTVYEREGVRIVHYFKSGDHGPPHLHVFEDDNNETRIGQNGQPLRHSAPLTARQAAVVKQFKAVIRKALRKIGRWHWYNEQ